MMTKISEALAKHDIKLVQDFDGVFKLDGDDLDAVNYYLDMLNRNEKLKFNLIKDLMLSDPDIEYAVKERASIMKIPPEPLNDDDVNREISRLIRSDFGKITDKNNVPCFTPCYD